MKVIITVLIVVFTYTHGFSQTYIGDKEEINQIIENTQNFSKYGLSYDLYMFYLSLNFIFDDS
ncbi:hypothetical protein [Aquimarina sp. I32.4]|uniref:hypothetical protein n=1 Tax=Aquimarina sp. I32.4 TaxID=2053903 RepID=UPI000CDEF105|nr:hypothetical protein [Aquimarina sp. I32.4]